MAWRAVAHRLAARAGLVVHRWPSNRFDAMPEALELLRRAGYRPATIIDCGANEGQFARIVTSVFPAAMLHVIEPQDCYWPALDRLARERGNTRVHKLAITKPGVRRVQMHRGGAEGSTGAFVTGPTEQFHADLESPATTLDELLADGVAAADRTLLKLDIEGHERAALTGARRLLAAVEVVYTEVRFFDIHHDGRPLFGDIAALLAEHDFQLYDFAMLSARPRDQRLRLGDAVFVHRDSALAADVNWA